MIDIASYLSIGVSFVKGLLQLIPFNQTIVTAAFAGLAAFIIEKRAISRFIVWSVFAVTIFILLIV